METRSPDKQTQPHLDRPISRILTRRSSEHHAHPPVQGPPGHEKALPAISDFNLWHRRWHALAYAIFVLFWNLAAPCILFYVLRNHTDLSLRALIGVSSATLGLSSSIDGPFRTWKLWKHNDKYGPLDDPIWWHMDFSMHLYTIVLLVFAIPLAVASAVNPPMPDFFLMSTPMLVGPVGLIMLISLFRPRIPIWLSSDPPKTPMKPAVYYLFEDIGAVDFRQGKEWRQRIRDRWNASPPWQDMIWYQTAFWALGTAVYFGATAAITWTVTFGFAFGFVLGFLFIWLLVWSVLSVWLAKWGLRREARWWEAGGNNSDEEALQTDEKTTHRKGPVEDKQTRQSVVSVDSADMATNMSTTGSDQSPQRYDQPARPLAALQANTTHRTSS